MDMFLLQYARFEDRDGRGFGRFVATKVNVSVCEPNEKPMIY